jgi:hypothetical protein
MPDTSARWENRKTTRIGAMASRSRSLGTLEEK